MGRDVLKICHEFADSFILNNRSIVHFCGWWNWEGHFLAIFCGCHKWVTSKTVIISTQKKCLESKRVQYSQNLNLNYKSYGNLIISPCSKYQEKTASSGIYFFKVNNGTTKTMCGICSKLTTKRRQNEVNNVILVSLMLTVNIFGTLFWCFHS